MRCLIFGRSGSGKSYGKGWIDERAIPSGDFTFTCMLDVEDEERGMSVEGGLLTSFYVSQEMYEEGINWSKIFREYRHLRIVPEDLPDDQLIELASDLARWTMDVCTSDRDISVYFSADECHQIMPQGNLSDALNRLVTGGRKHGVEFCLATQRPALVDKTVLTQTDYLVIFQVKANDVEQIQDAVSFDAEMAESGNMGKRECIIEDLDSGQWTHIDTEEVMTRRHPHISPDGGEADGVIDQLF